MENSAHSLVVEELTGLPMARECFQLSMLERSAKLLVMNENSSLLLVQKRGNRLSVDVCETIEDVKQSLSLFTNLSDITRPSKKSSNRFNFDIEALDQVLGNQEKDFEELVFTLIEMNDMKISTDEIIQRIIELKARYSLEFILSTIQAMSPTEMRALMATRNPISFFNNFISDEPVHHAPHLRDLYGESEEDDEDEDSAYRNLYPGERNPVIWTDDSDEAEIFDLEEEDFSED